MLFDALIFDMDGLMVDTEPLSLAAWNEALAPFGKMVDDALYHQVIGRSGDETVHILCAALDLDVDPQRLGAEAGEAWLRLLHAGVPMMPGIETVHGLLRAYDVPWGVATASPRPVAELVVSQLAFAADCRGLATGSDVARSKPAPDVYLLAAEQLGVDPRRCLALEDSIPGCQAAQAAGMTVFAVPGSHTAASAFGFADDVVASLTVVAGRLPALFGCEQG